jgi:hypothetical protein
VTFVVKTQLAPEAIRRAIRPAIFDIDRNLTIAELSTLRSALDDRLEERRGLLRLFVALSLLTLVLAAIGVYSVTATSSASACPNSAFGPRWERPAGRSSGFRCATASSYCPSASRSACSSPPRGRTTATSPAGCSAVRLDGTVPRDGYSCRCVVIAAYGSARRGAGADPIVHMNSD